MCGSLTNLKKTFKYPPQKKPTHPDLPRLRGIFVILACILLVSRSGLSIIVAFRKAIPNSTSLILPMTLPLARRGPPVSGEMCGGKSVKTLSLQYFEGEKVRLLMLRSIMWSQGFLWLTKHNMKQHTLNDDVTRLIPGRVSPETYPELFYEMTSPLSEKSNYHLIPQTTVNTSNDGQRKKQNELLGEFRQALCSYLVRILAKAPEYINHTDTSDFCVPVPHLKK